MYRKRLAYGPQTGRLRYEKLVSRFSENVGRLKHSGADETGKCLSDRIKPGREEWSPIAFTDPDNSPNGRKCPK